jgi:hypothetical protein
MSESGAKGKSGTESKSGETARELLRRTKQITRRKFPAEEKIRMLLEGIRAEFSVAELCRRVGSPPAAFRATSGGASVPAPVLASRPHANVGRPGLSCPSSVS